MSKKLQNTKAVKQLLDGTHSTQTKKTINWTPKVNFKKIVKKMVNDELF